MRPDRDYLAAPDLPETLVWVNGESSPLFAAEECEQEGGLSMPALTAPGPALVHFLDFAQVNSVRTLPYLSEWARRYGEHGMQTIGVQAPLVIDNAESSWLARQFAAEYAIQFREILPLIARLDWPMPLGGTSNHFRVAALRDAGGWDPFNVTEDADLGIRLYRLGYRASILPSAT